MTNNETTLEDAETIPSQTVSEYLSIIPVTVLNYHHERLNFDYPVSGDHLPRIKQARK